MKKLRIQTDYRRHRAAAYPPMGDQLDAIAKGFRALMDQGLQLPPQTVAWVEEIKRVKATIKK
jgi:hypothetical protein